MAGDVDARQLAQLLARRQNGNPQIAGGGGGIMGNGGGQGIKWGDAKELPAPGSYQDPGIMGNGGQGGIPQGGDQGIKWGDSIELPAPQGDQGMGLGQAPIPSPYPQPQGQQPQENDLQGLMAGKGPAFQAWVNRFQAGRHKPPTNTFQDTSQYLPGQ